MLVKLSKKLSEKFGKIKSDDSSKISSPKKLIYVASVIGGALILSQINISDTLFKILVPIIAISIQVIRIKK